MPTIYTLFEEAVKEDLYMKVESDFPSEIFSVAAQSVTLVETLSAASPIMVLRLADQFGDLVNHTYISPDTSYDVYFGKSPNENMKCSFSLSVGTASNYASGVIENVAMEINFLRHNWEKLISQTHSRSWNNVRYSDVVRQIAEEAGFTSFDIEETDERLSVIQPGWTNIQLLKWIQGQARSTSGISGFDIGARLDGSFIFKTFDKLFDQKPKFEYILSDEYSEDSIWDMNIIQEYSPMTTQGAFGITYSYFDYENKEFKTDDMVLSETNQRQISDRYFLAKSHEVPMRRMYGGRNTRLVNEAENRILQTANSIQSLKITVKGNTNLHIGDMINIVLQSSRVSKSPVSEPYSGYWLVSKVSHFVSFQSKMHQTVLELSRPGMDGTRAEMDRLVKTKVGKILKQ